MWGFILGAVARRCRLLGVPALRRRIGRRRVRRLRDQLDRPADAVRGPRVARPTPRLATATRAPAVHSERLSRVCSSSASEGQLRGAVPGRPVLCAYDLRRASSTRRTHPCGPIATVFTLLAEVELWPALFPHIRSARVLRRDEAPAASSSRLRLAWAAARLHARSRPSTSAQVR